ncbi:tRNA-splicing endonuclease subunit Sen54 [Patella vulgata]|uniref:tRNA-splicing endonuclease subunit Sen54 n=1 Tax=Patella vulgata TaxID=6465 RepID=UPI0024A89508|nr:tRNA-splicing endonuclease subunit Sen54 [Patella vulgata]
MNPNIVLSGSELFKNHLTCDHSVPQKGGSKEIEFDGSWIQAKRLSSYYEERHALLKEQRTEKLGNLVRGIWNPEKYLIEFEREMGKFWSNMGFVDHKRKWLYPEEALFLMESNMLEVAYNDIPLSIEEAYNEFMSHGINLEEYQVYCHLRRHGYLVRRHQPLSTDYEVSIKLNQHVSKPRKRKRKKKEMNRNIDSVDENINHIADGVCDEDLSMRLEKQRKKNDKECDITDDDVEDDFLVSPDKELSSKTETSDICGFIIDKNEEFTEEGKICDKSENNRNRSNQLNNPVKNEFDSLHCDINKFCSSKASANLSLEQTKWDFSQICFPNIANADHVTVNVPLEQYLPEGIKIEESCEFNVLEHQAKYSVPRFDPTNPVDKDLHFSYADWVKAKTTVSASNWKEYKSKLKKAQQCLETDSPADILWQGEVTPLIRPEDATSTGKFTCNLIYLRNVQFVIPFEQLEHPHLAYVTPRSELPLYPKFQTRGRPSVATNPEQTDRQTAQQCLETDSPADILWQGEVTPLIRPEDATSTANILSKLQVIQVFEEEILKRENPTEFDSSFKISFDVFLPDAKFRKTDPGKPNHRVCITRSTDDVPNLKDIHEGTLKDGVPVHWAVLDNGDVAFYSFQQLNLPSDITIG